MKRILITGSFKFPNQDAAGLRVYSVAKLFDEHNQVSVCGWEKDYKGEKDYIHDGFSCVAQGDLEYTSSNPISKSLNSIFRGHHTLSWLRKQKRFDTIILYNPPAVFSLILQIYCLIKNTKLVIDSTEWYESSHLSSSVFSLPRLENNARMYFSYKFFKNTICISDFLNEYFKKNSIVIPPMFVDPINKELSCPPLDDNILFLYAGQMGQKDSLEHFILTLPKLAEKLPLKPKLILLGMTFEDLQKIIKDKEGLLKSAMYIECMGRVSREEVGEYYKKIHFVIFFRENKRYAIAGFPSKSIEAWQHGKPIVTNPVGELKKYLKNNENSLVIENDSEGMLQLIERLNEVVSNNRYSLLSQNAYSTFENHFTPDVNKEKFKKFIDNLK